VLRSADEVFGVARTIFGTTPLPKQLAILGLLSRLPSDAELTELARELHTTRAWLTRVLASPRPVFEALGVELPDIDDTDRSRVRRTLGQLLLGTLAEHAFEEIYRSELGTDDLELEDSRQGYSETDYRVLNGGGRQVFRLNIKFHGTLFQNAKDLVGLESEDCFPLATYKIFQAKVREAQEVLPYVFAIVSVPGLAAEHAGAAIAGDLIDFMAVVQRSSLQRKRAIEDRIIAQITGISEFVATANIREFSDRIRAAPWRLISATKADRLLRELLFDRVYAVRVRAFARNYRNAELDMHFSLSRDLTSLGDFLAVVRDRGLHGVTAQLTAGLI